MKDWKKNKKSKRIMAFLLVSAMLLTSLIGPNSTAASIGELSNVPGETGEEIGNPDGTGTKSMSSSRCRSMTRWRTT